MYWGVFLKHIISTYTHWIKIKPYYQATSVLISFAIAGHLNLAQTGLNYFKKCFFYGHLRLDSIF